MRGLFDIDGPLMDALRKFSDLVLFNLIFCLLSLPVITIGAAMTALNECIQLLIEDKDSDLRVWQTFWGSFRRNFVPGTKLWLVCILAGGYMYALQNAVVKLSESEGGSGLGSTYAITYYVCAIVFLLGYQNFFPTRARWQKLTLFGGIARAFTISVIALPWTMLGIFLTYGFAFVTLIMNGNVFRFGIFLWAVCGFGIVAYFSNMCFLKGAEKLENGLAAKEAGQKVDTAPVGGSIFVDTVNRIGEAQKDAVSRREAAAAQEQGTEGEAAPDDETDQTSAEKAEKET